MFNIIKLPPVPSLAFTLWACIKSGKNAKRSRSFFMVNKVLGSWLIKN
jgi:hypothetical protein